MADPRFYDNCGPFTPADLCAGIGAELSRAAAPDSLIHDVAALDGAGPLHLAFCTGTKAALRALAETAAGFVLVPEGIDPSAAPSGALLLTAPAPEAAFAAAVRRFYPGDILGSWAQQTPVDPSSIIASDVSLAPGVVIGPGAEIGAGTRIGANTVIGRGVAIGRDCEIGPNVTISHAYLGDHAVIQAGARIGEPGYGFTSSAKGHVRIPQIGRVLIQDSVEIGANAAIDRGALGDTVIGEGTKIDNLVHIGHNGRLGRHCLITGQVGFAGSVEVGDFVVMGGQVAIADHTRIGDGVRIAGKAGLPPGEYPGGTDYGGFPARPIQQWRREVATLALLAKRRKRDK